MWLPEGPAQQWFPGNANSGALDEARNAVGVHLQLVALAERAELGWLGWSDPPAALGLELGYPERARTGSSCLSCLPGPLR
jgi:hypothetical protein